MILYFFLYVQEREYVLSEGILSVVFLNAGQGDSILITTPEGSQMLIDTSATGDIVREISKELKYFDRKIDVVLLTHGDLDHIGGTPDILKRYEVDTLVYSFDDESGLISEIERLSVGKEITHVEVRSGDVFELDEVIVEVLWPIDNYVGEKNDESIVTSIKYIDVEFLLTGDASVDIEEKLVRYEGIKDVDVLKLGHHGSKTSSSEEFLSFVNPQYVVVSAGERNKFGHPHEEVIERVKDREIKKTTDSAVVFETDGYNIWVR